MTFLRAVVFAGLSGLAALPGMAKDGKAVPVEPVQSTPADDQPSCAFTDAILGLAQDTLDTRSQLNGFATRRFGTLEAYLILHYAGLSFEDGLALLQRVISQERRPPYTADQLLANYLVRHLGVEKGGLARLGEDPVKVFASLGPQGGERAILLADNGRSYFELIKQVRGRPDLAPDLDRSFASGKGGRPVVLLDASDEVKLSIARYAEAADELPMAARFFLPAGRT